MKHGERTRQAILDAGLDLWRADPSAVLSARRIARALGMTHGAILYHWSDAAGLRAALAVEAVRVRDARLVPMLIAQKHPATAALQGAERAAFMSGC